jgi:hypothetical protein
MNCDFFQCELTFSKLAGETAIQYVIGPRPMMTATTKLPRPIKILSGYSPLTDNQRVRRAFFHAMRGVSAA